MVGMGGWDIIKLHDMFIYEQGVNMGGSSKAGCRLQSVDARGVVKNRLGGKRYLVIVRQGFFNPDLDDTLLAEDQIDCFCVKLYSRPRVFGGKQLVDARYKVGGPFKLDIYWGGSNIYLCIHPLTR